MILFENILTQYDGLLKNKLLYIHTSEANCRMLYNDLIDSGILYFFNNKLIDVNELGLTNVVRITSKNNEFARFNKNIIHKRFVPSFKQTYHKYNEKNIFAYKHDKFNIINYDFMLRDKKITQLIKNIEK